MKKQTSLLLLILVTAIIGIELPAAFSVGGGQHQFNQIDSSNPSAFCEKCHGNGDSINAELQSSGNGLYNSGMKIHSTVGCTGCHEVTSGYGNATGTKTEHAAKIPTCIKCHTVGGEAVFLGDVVQEINSTTEAHNNFNTDIACIGCHTSVQVTGAINYTYSGSETIAGLTIGN